MLGLSLFNLNAKATHGNIFIIEVSPKDGSRVDYQDQNFDIIVKYDFEFEDSSLDPARSRLIINGEIVDFENRADQKEIFYSTPSNLSGSVTIEVLLVETGNGSQDSKTWSFNASNHSVGNSDNCPWIVFMYLVLCCCFLTIIVLIVSGVIFLFKKKSK